jgi:anti-anti-sigma factor
VIRDSGRGQWSLRVVEERQEGVLIVTVVGRLGHASLGHLSAVLDAAVDANAAGFVIDLQGVDYVSSPALTAIFSAVARLAELHGVLILCAVPQPVQIALHLAGLPPQLAIETSRDRAVARLAVAEASGE